MTRKYAQTWQHHIVRYAFAAPYCYRKKVMDAGCQTGWGGNLLSYVANSVTYVDINENWLGTAKSLRHFCPVDFIAMNFEKEFPDKNVYKQDTTPPVLGWDTIVAFVVIEHLENPHIFLEGVKKNLTPGGKFLFSVPHMVENHEHKQLYDATKINDLISKYLKVDAFYVQSSNPITLGPMYGNLRCYVGIGTKE